MTHQMLRNWVTQTIFFANCNSETCSYIEERYQEVDGRWMFVILIQGINRNLPMTDWTQFMWLASHPTEYFINQAEEPRKEGFI